VLKQSFSTFEPTEILARELTTPEFFLVDVEVQRAPPDDGVFEGGSQHPSSLAHVILSQNRAHH